MSTPVSKTLNVILWIAQVLLAAIMFMGAVMKFMPVNPDMMPWAGEVSPMIVKLLGVIDLLGGLGLILPGLLRLSQRWTVLAATGVFLLMVCAIIFHVSRGESEVIGFNIVAAAVAAFIAWGRNKRYAR